MHNVVSLKDYKQFSTRQCRTFIAMYELSKSEDHLKRALESDYAFTVIYAIEKKFYWKIQDAIRAYNLESKAS